MHDEAVPSATRRIQQYAMRERRVAWHKAEVCYTGPGWRPTSGAWRGVGRHPAATEPVSHVVRLPRPAVLRVALAAQVPTAPRLLDHALGNAPGRERVWQARYDPVVAVFLKKKKKHKTE